MKMLRINVTSYVYNLFTKNSKLSLQITDLNKLKGVHVHGSQDLVLLKLQYSSMNL